ncbi:MAG: Hsp20/alpha crystallin family protein [Myxococcaceae bacterium]
MANLPVKRGTQGTTIAPRMPEWTFDPFQPMRELMRWDPFTELARSFQRPTATFVPAFEVKETKDAFVFKSDLPGMTDKDIDVSLAGNRLTISGKREAEQQDSSENYYTYERSYGSFMRCFTLPDTVDADHVRADLKDGVLTVSVPKTPEAQPKKISIKSNGEKAKA